MTDQSPDRVAAAVESSTVARTVRRCEAALARTARGSRLVRWFLADPDPDVVVIDLRDTYTVGPVVAGVEWVSERAASAAEAVGLAAAVRTVAGRVVSAPLRAFGLVTVILALVGATAASLAGHTGSLGGYLVLLGLGLLATRERRSVDELAETRVGRALNAAFEPPDPPERGDQ